MLHITMEYLMNLPVFFSKLCQSGYINQLQFIVPNFPISLTILSYSVTNDLFSFFILFLLSVNFSLFLLPKSQKHLRAMHKVDSLYHLFF